MLFPASRKRGRRVERIELRAKAGTKLYFGDCSAMSCSQLELLSLLHLAQINSRDRVTAVSRQVASHSIAIAGVAEPSRRTHPSSNDESDEEY